MTFKIHFFDGKTSRTHKATLSAGFFHWKINYIDEKSMPIEVSWDPQKVKKADVYTKGLVSFTYGDTFPFQKIESTDEKFIEYVNTNHKHLRSSIDVLLHASKWRSVLFLLTVMLGIGLVSYFYVIPTVATGFATRLPKENVIDFGNYVFKLSLIHI